LKEKKQAPKNVRKNQQISDDDIINALNVTCGNVLKASKLLKCCYSTIYKRFKENPAIKTAVEDGRISGRLDLVQMAEDALTEDLTQEDDPMRRQRAAFFILNTHDTSKKRDWNKPEDKNKAENIIISADIISALNSKKEGKNG